jgi:hypothetical protein
MPRLTVKHIFCELDVRLQIPPRLREHTNIPKFASIDLSLSFTGAFWNMTTDWFKNEESCPPLST